MRKSEFSESQITAVLKEAEAGTAVADVCRQHGIRAATFYQWRSKYGGTGVSELQRLHELEKENGRLKRMYAELSLDHALLREVLKKVLSPAQRRQAVQWLQEERTVSERRAYRIVGQPRATQRRTRGDRLRHDARVEVRLVALAHAHRQWDCPQLHDPLRLEGYPINHKRTARLCPKHHLALRRRRWRRRRLPAAARNPLLQPIQPNVCWSLDFMGDSLADGRSYRTLNVLDDYVRDALAIEIDLSPAARRVKRVLERLCDSDNGSGRRRAILQDWAHDRGIRWDFSQNGHPEQNAYIERFNGTYRREVLNAYQFNTIAEARRVSEAWRRVYNEQRAHSAIGHLPPTVFKQLWQQRQSLLMAGSV